MMMKMMMIMPENVPFIVTNELTFPNVKYPSQLKHPKEKQSIASADGQSRSLTLTLTTSP